MSEHNGCNCDLCQYFRKFAEHLSHVPEEHQPFFEELLDMYLDQGLDYDVSKAIIDGSWPTADKWIKSAREQRSRKQKEYEEQNKEHQ
jgi:hypothetical protein